MELDEMTDDRETESQARVLTRRPGLFLSEAIEHERQEFRSNPWA
jgi:hypothetical protein